MRFLLRALAAAAGFWLASRIVHGVHVSGWVSLVEAGLLLGVFNALVRPILTILTLPLTIVTLGLFLLVVNGVTVWLVTVFIHGVRVPGLWPAILTSLIISVTSWVAGAVLRDLDEPYSARRGRYGRI
jgi:putative membrane protein